MSAPLRWERLSSGSAGGPAAYTIGNSGRRLAGSKTDPWSGYFQIDQEITDDMTRAVGLDPRLLNERGLICDETAAAPARRVRPAREGGWR